MTCHLSSRITARAARAVRPWMACVLLGGFLASPATLAALPVAAVEQVEEEAPEAVVVRFHDLSDLNAFTVVNSRELRVLPFLEQEEDIRDEDELDLGDLIENLIYDQVAPEAFEYEGRSLERLEDGRLLVVGPEALQQRIAHLIEGFRGAFRRSARVGLDVYEVVRGRSLPADLDGETLRALAEAGSLRLLHRRQDTVRVGHTERLKALTSTAVVSEWGSEIAQHMAIAAPDMMELDVGLDLALRLESVPGSSQMRMRHGLFVSRLKDLSVDVVKSRNKLRLENSVDTDVTNLAVDLPVVSSVSNVGSCVVGAGEGPILVGQVQTYHGTSSWVAHLRLLEVQEAPEVLSFGKVAVAIVDTSAARWPRSEPAAWTSLQLAGREGELFWGVRHTFGDVEQAFPSSEHVEWEGALESCERGMSTDSEENGWDYEGWSWDHGRWAVWSAGRELLARRLGAFEAIAAGHRNLVVEFGVMENAGPASAPRSVAEGRMALESGGTGSVLVGDTFMRRRGFDVDVATGAAAVQPRTGHAFDGLSVHAQADNRGAFVEVEVASCRMLEEESVELSSMAPGAFMRSTFSLADRKVTVPVDGQRHVVAELDSTLDMGSKRSLWVLVRRR